MLREGGRWNTTELGEVLGMEPKAVHGHLGRMADRGMCIRTHSGGRINHTYHVTLKCKTPRGVTLQQLVDAGLVSLTKGSA